MLSLFILFSVYFTIPSNSAMDSYTTKCENQQEYILYNDGMSFNGNIRDKDNNSIFQGILSDRINFMIKSFYCIDNNLYLLLAEVSETGSALSELNIYKVDNNNLSQEDSIEYANAYNVVINNNQLIYNNYNDHYFYKATIAKTFGTKAQYLYTPDYSFNDNTLYFEDIDSLLYVDKNMNTLKLHSTSENIQIYNYPVLNLYDALYFGDKWYFLLETEAKKIKIVDENNVLYHEYSSSDDSGFKKGFLNINEDGIYAFILTDTKFLKIISVPAFNPSKKLVKNFKSNISNIYRDGDDYYYLKNIDSETDIILIEDDCLVPSPPIVGDEIIGVKSNKPSSFTLSNFEDNMMCFMSYQLEISTNRDFTSVIYGDTVSYYNENSSSQTYSFYNNFSFEEDKAYYIRVNYNGIMGSSEFTYIRLIITDLGEITNFEILDVTSNSKLYTNNEMINMKIEKLGFVKKFQFSDNENFKNINNEDILAIDFNPEFSFLLPSEEKEYTYFVRPVIIVNNNLLGSHQTKIARITLDKTAPDVVDIITQDETFFKENIEIKWELTSDNLSGVNNYKIRLVDSLSNEKEAIVLENTKNFYSPSVLLETGIYTFFISSCDNAENCSQESKTNLTVTIKENIKPYRPSLIRPKNKDVIESMPFNILWSKSDDPENDVVSYSLIIAKDKEFTQIEFEAYLIESLSKDITYLSEGRYYLKLFAVDSNGNESDYEIIEFDVIEPSNGSNSSAGCSF